MSPGSPQPMIVMKVGVSRAMRSSGDIDEDSVRMYSWQFCIWSARRFCDHWEVSTYATEEVADEDNQLAGRRVRGVI